MIDYFSDLLLNKFVVFPQMFYNIRCMAANSERHSEFFFFFFFFFCYGA